MRKVNQLRNFIQASLLCSVLLTSLVAAPLAQALDGVDPKTRDMLIDKLTRVYLNLAPEDASKVPITMRLADLHAERARVDAMKELANGCTSCVAGKADRLKALRYYQEALPKMSESALGKVLTQVGHLYELTGNEKEAVATYERILVDNKTPEAVVEARLSLAEVHFKRRDWARARENYSAVIESPVESASRGLANYRRAWCDFNEGRLEEAVTGLTKILRTPSLSSRSAASGGEVDRQFQEEVSRDLATFMARRTVDVKDAELVFELSPEASRLTNVVYLASEVERLGERKSAIALWRFALAKQATPVHRLEATVRIAQLELEQKNVESALGDYRSALALWTQVGECREGNCKELALRLRKFVLDWNRIEKDKPSDALFAAYEAYLEAIPNEADMSAWAAKVAKQVAKYERAIELGHKAAATAKAEYDKVKDVEAEKATAARLIQTVEASLLEAIEAAELASDGGRGSKTAGAANAVAPSATGAVAGPATNVVKDTKLLTTAYDGYLSLSLSRQKALEVQYQKAHLVYDRGEYLAASEALKSVVESKESPGSASEDLRKRAADLALDALVLAKDDRKIEEWAKEFAAKFPRAGEEFSAIARKSVLTQASALAATGPKGLEEAWATLARFDLVSASSEDKAALQKNRLILAEKTARFQDARDAAEALLRSPVVSVADRDYALSRKAWLAELVLDFDSALQATESMAAGSVKLDEKWLKLAMYAELAQKDPKPYYGQFLKESKDEERKLAILAQLVRSSKDPLKEIEKNKLSLAKSPETWADLYLDAFSASNGALDVAKKALTVPQLKTTRAVRLMARALLLDDLGKLKARLAVHKIDGSSDKKLASTLKARIQLLDEVEKLTARSIETADWTSQLASLDLRAKENDRFYQEVLSLPVPSGLSEEEQRQYQQLLSQQAAPHQLRSTDAAKKVDEFWSQETAFAKLESSAAQTTTASLRNIMLKEIETLEGIAPEATKPKLASMKTALNTKIVLPSLNELEAARQAVRLNPIDPARLTALMEIERKMGRAVMVSYLEGRLAKIQAGRSE